MAITKILNIQESESRNPVTHLKNALEYIQNPDKTEKCVLVGSINCLPDTAFEQMEETKNIFHKTGKRQGYHVIISFSPEEKVTAEQAMYVLEHFAKDVLGDDYEAVYAVHTDREHMHGHLIWNSVSVTTGKKYNSPKSNWKNHLQPITNKYCDELGLSIMPAEYSRNPKNISRDKWEREMSMKEIILRDAKMCAYAAGNVEHFKYLMKRLGYVFKIDAWMEVQAPGFKYYHKLAKLDEMFSEETLRHHVDIGINPNMVKDMKKNFVNQLNNPDKMSPTLYLSIEDIVYEGMTLLWVYVPPTSTVEKCANRIYDRNEDGDMDITDSPIQLQNMYNRKSNTYAEHKIFPYVTTEDLRMDLMGKVRNLAKSKNPDHPWLKMSDEEILKSAGLWEKDFSSGIQGYNLAGVLLFGKDDVIRSCCPGYITDALYRVENLDRYDDRLQVTTNLIEAYDLLMEFVAKHTSDKFCLINNISTSIRGIISREVIGNILVHRDYSSAYPAKVIIEKDWLRTENWCIPRRHGNIMSDEFTPYPKNPLIQQFFANIGRTDTIGSGVRNLYKYTPMYSDGGKPELIEDDVFRINIPLDRIVADEATEQKTLSEREQKIYNMICENLHLSVEQVMAELDISRSTVFRDYAKIKKITGAMYDKKTSTWTLD